MFRKKIMIGLISVLILLTVFPFVSRTEVTNAGDKKMITVPFYTLSMGEMKWDFPYSDRYFLGESHDFSRELAKASLGLTFSAFRKDKNSTVSNQYKTYLGKAGFQDIYAFGYDQPTRTDSLSGVIASKKIGDFTLLAASPCGQGYEKEWCGNLEVGEGERHAGFNHGAQILEKEIVSYIEKHKLTGKLKLWISSFSRGSAVSNLAAADLIDSGIFEDVFAYLYAVPRTTKKPTVYPNICNICGAFDPVTQVPLESWGFYRNGWDLYLPAAETTAQFDMLSAYANDVSLKVAGDRFRYNPEMNYQLHLILEFLGEMFPSSQEYCLKIQDHIMGLWKEANPDQMFLILEDVFKSLDDLDRRQEYSRKVFLDYLDQIASMRLGDTRDSLELRDLSWAEDQSLAANLMREHMPYIYLSWIFSDLSNQVLMKGSFATQRISVGGDVDVEVWQNGRFLNGIDPSGYPIFRSDGSDEDWTEESIRNVFMVRYGLETMIFLPDNDDFQVRIVTPEETALSYWINTCYLPYTYGTSAGFHIAIVKAGTYELRFREFMTEPPDELVPLEGEIITTISDEDRTYSPLLAMEKILTAWDKQTVKGAIIILILVLAAVSALLLTCLIIAIVHRINRKKHGPYSPWYVIIPHYLMLILFVWLTIYSTKFLYMIPLARMGFAAASGLTLFLIALRGLLRNRNRWNVLIMIGMLAVSALDVFVYQRSQIVGANLTIYIVYCVIMAALAALASATFWFRKKKKESDG